MAAKKNTHPHVALYERLVATLGDVECKGSAIRFTSVNGNMFSFVGKDGSVGLRLANADRTAFLEKYKTKLSVQYGSTLKEYVDVPPGLLAKPGELKRYFASSYAYANSLKPKATTRRTKKKGSARAQARAAPADAAPGPANSARPSPRRAAKASTRKRTKKKASASSRRDTAKGR